MKLLPVGAYAVGLRASSIPVTLARLEGCQLSRPGDGVLRFCRGSGHPTAHMDSASAGTFAAATVPVCYAILAHPLAAASGWFAGCTVGAVAGCCWWFCVSLLPDDLAAAHHLSYFTCGVGHSRPVAVVVLAAVLGWFFLSGRTSPMPSLRSAVDVAC